MTPIEWVGMGGMLSTFGLLTILVIHNFRMQDQRRRIERLEIRLDDHVEWLHAPRATLTKSVERGSK